ncbi:MAG: TIGR02452 family protein [Bacteroidales bacterium]|nr:TIGR02452 family protein [Bacteroidales bacterium]
MRIFAKRTGKTMDKHASRIEIFNSTLALLKQGWYIAQDGTQITLPSTEEVMSAARMYKEPVRVMIDPLKPIRTEIRVENKDCVLAAKQLIDDGYNPAMLNLADLYTPGGLVEYGSGAQEENLCRRSNLILSLYQFSHARIYQHPGLGLKQSKDQYPMDEHFGGIYSGICTFFRGPESEGSLLENVPYNIPVISVAAISGPRIGADGMMLKEEADITLDKMRTIFRIGKANFHDSLVLSAMGCGAFANPPAHIAKLFHQVIEEDEFKNTFRLIDFAILDGYRTGMRHNPEGNLLPFQKEFEQ